MFGGAAVGVLSHFAKREFVKVRGASHGRFWAQRRVLTQTVGLSFSCSVPCKIADAAAAAEVETFHVRDDEDLAESIGAPLQIQRSQSFEINHTVCQTKDDNPTRRRVSHESYFCLSSTMEGLL
mmetsp:Transcript_15968/g.35949  ORF Transcript_15968/g.35949 Transcript_15968/m.35949 type:complete len:124 (-) Transcript_15968:201-572(-)